MGVFLYSSVALLTTSPCLSSFYCQFTLKRFQISLLQQPASLQRLGESSLFQAESSPDLLPPHQLRGCASCASLTSPLPVWPQFRWLLILDDLFAGNALRHHSQMIFDFKKEVRKFAIDSSVLKSYWVFPNRKATRGGSNKQCARF